MGVTTFKQVIEFNPENADLNTIKHGDKSLLSLNIPDELIEVCARKGKLQCTYPLVIGGNGFVGIHLTHSLLMKNEIEKVVVIVRPGKKKTSEERLLAMFKKYKLEVNENLYKKLICYEGNITKDQFDLDDKVYTDLLYKVDCVFQCASSTDYTTPYETFRNDWVLGLLRIINFCVHGQLKMLTYLGSTISELFQSKADMQFKHTWWYSGYGRLKWLNQAMIKILQDKSFPFFICHAPYILGSTTIGLDPGLTYSVWRGILLSQTIGFCYEGTAFNFVPVDILVNTIIDNVFLDEKMPILRPSNIKPYTFSEIAPIFNCKVVTWDEYYQRLQKNSSWLPLVNEILSEDLPEIIQKTNLPPIFTPQFDTLSIPSTIDLYAFYASKLPLELYAERLRNEMIV